MFTIWSLRLAILPLECFLHSIQTMSSSSDDDFMGYTTAAKKLSKLNAQESSSDEDLEDVIPELRNPTPLISPESKKPATETKPILSLPKKGPKKTIQKKKMVVESVDFDLIEASGSGTNHNSLDSDHDSLDLTLPNVSLNIPKTRPQRKTAKKTPVAKKRKKHCGDEECENCFEETDEEFMVAKPAKKKAPPKKKTPAKKKAPKRNKTGCGNPTCRNCFSLPDSDDDLIAALNADLYEERRASWGRRRRGGWGRYNNPMFNIWRRQATPRSTRRNRMPITYEPSDDGAPMVFVSDNEEEKTKKNEAVAEVNCEYDLKVWWQFREISSFKIRKYQTMQSIFDFYSERENIPMERLVFLVDENFIKPDDTPDSLNITRYQIIEGGYVTDGVVNVAGKMDKTSTQAIQLKILMQEKKKPLMVAIKKDEPFSILMAKCSEALQLDVKDMRFSFDGDTLKATDTPLSLEFEGGECIDVHMK